MTGWRNSTRADRLPADWPVRRRHVLERDGHTCRLKSPDCTIVATEVDHITPGDDHHESNLQAACTACHKRKTIAERPTPPPLHRPPEQHPGLL
jgi:5-methylcytosine-specific restriction endonuclease McrA